MDKPQHPAQATYDAKIELHQAAFLAAYAECGTVAAAALAIGLTASAVYDWKKADRFGFLDRFALAGLAFGEKLEELALKRVEAPTGKGGGDILLIAMLNANKPDKWRRNDAPSGAIAAPSQTVINIIVPAGAKVPETMTVEGESRQVEDE